VAETVALVEIGVAVEAVAEKALVADQLAAVEIAQQIAVDFSTVVEVRTAAEILAVLQTAAEVELFCCPVDQGSAGAASTFGQ